MPCIAITWKFLNNLLVGAEGREILYYWKDIVYHNGFNVQLRNKYFQESFFIIITICIATRNDDDEARTIRYGFCTWCTDELHAKENCW